LGKLFQPAIRCDQESGSVFFFPAGVFSPSSLSFPITVPRRRMDRGSLQPAATVSPHRRRADRFKCLMLFVISFGEHLYCHMPLSLQERASQVALACSDFHPLFLAKRAQLSARLLCFFSSQEFPPQNCLTHWSILVPTIFSNELTRHETRCTWGPVNLGTLLLRAPPLLQRPGAGTGTTHHRLPEIAVREGQKCFCKYLEISLKSRGVR